MICVNPPKTTRQKVADFFARMPDESLTAGDVTAKFGVSRQAANRLLNQMIDAGTLKRTPAAVDGGQLGYEYSAK